MEFIFELLLELILDGTLAMSQSKKVPKIIRYPLICIIIFLFLGVSFVIFYTGILAYQKINKVVGIFLMVISIIFIITGIIKFKKTYLQKKDIR